MNARVPEAFLTISSTLTRLEQRILLTVSMRPGVFSELANRQGLPTSHVCLGGQRFGTAVRSLASAEPRALL